MRLRHSDEGRHADLHERGSLPAGHFALVVVLVLTIAQMISFGDRYLPSLLVEPLKAAFRLTDFQVVFSWGRRSFSFMRQRPSSQAGWPIGAAAG